MLNKVYIKYNPLIKEDTYNKMIEIVKSWPLQGSPCNWADSNSYTQFKKHGVFWIDGTYPFSYGVDCSNQGYKEISIQDIFNHELLKVEKWALGTFVLFLKDVAGARKGTIDIIEDNAPDSIYLKSIYLAKKVEKMLDKSCGLLQKKVLKRIIKIYRMYSLRVPALTRKVKKFLV